MEMVIFVGLQASGKSTYYAQNFAETHLRINLDMLRTRTREELLLRHCLEAGIDVVIDNTNPTRGEREKYFVLAKQYNTKVIGYYFSAKVNECIQRNSLRTDKSPIPEKGLRAVWRKMERAEFSEGFDELYSVRLRKGRHFVEEHRDEIQ